MKGLRLNYKRRAMRPERRLTRLAAPQRAARTGVRRLRSQRRRGFPKPAVSQLDKVLDLA